MTTRQAQPRTSAQPTSVSTGYRQTPSIPAAIVRTGARVPSAAHVASAFQTQGSAADRGFGDGLTYMSPTIMREREAVATATPATRGAKPGPAMAHRRSDAGRRTIGRKEVLGVGFASMLAVLVPAGVAHAAGVQAAKTEDAFNYPVSAMLSGYPQLYQQHSLSCEAAAASMATGGRVTEQQILNKMPYNANPYLGFRGNVDGGQSVWDGLTSYGIYAPPLAQELRSFGYQTQLISGSTAPTLLRHAIGVLGRPVEIWVTHGLGNYAAITANAGGQTFTLINGEHARLAIGYDSYGLHTLDPIDGPQYDAWTTILPVWARLNYMGIIVGHA
jgi:uncharacterized protein YvpB